MDDCFVNVCLGWVVVVVDLVELVVVGVGCCLVVLNEEVVVFEGLDLVWFGLDVEEEG